MQFVRHSGLTLPEVLDVLQAFKSLEAAHNGQAFDTFDDLMTEGGLSWKALAAALKGRGQTFADLVSRISASKQDLFGLTNAWMASGKSLSDFLLDQQGFGTKKAGVDVKIDPAKLLGVVLDMAKFGYSIIKDNAAQTKTDGANTSVLHTQVKDPFAYGNAKTFSSREFRWEGKNLFTMTLFEVKFHVRGTYGATSNQVGGHYMPSIFSEFTHTYALWPWKVNGSADLSKISNMGSIEAPNPQIDLNHKLEAGILLQHLSTSFPLTLQGSTGIVRQ
jgi:hypothetical protein